MQKISLIVAVVLLCGCVTTPLVWTQAGLTEADVSADVLDCRILARDEAWRMTWEMMWPPSFYDPRFMPPFYRSPSPFWFDYPMSFERERALRDFCMHSKGYRLRALPE